MTKNPRRNRYYGTSELPTLNAYVVEPKRQEVLLELYSQICDSWRLLTDVRFKLLGFVPTVSVAVLLTLLSREQSNGLSRPSLVAISIFGLLVTLALLIYELRNSQLYDDLISRARKIEQELGIDTGQFLGRRTTPNPLIKHDVAIKLIYGTAIGGWVFVIAIVALRFDWLAPPP